MKSKASAVIAITFIISGLTGGLRAAVELLDGSAAGFPLVAGGVAAPIVMPADAPEVVKIAAGDLADDIAAVTGQKPEILTTLPTDPNRPHV